jgi:hypothetical protein
VRGAELNAGGPGLEQRAGLGCHLVGRSGEREPVQHGVGDHPAGSLVVTGADQPLYRGQVDPLQTRTGIQRGDDREIGGHLGAGQAPGRRPVLVDDGDSSADQADLAARPPHAGLAARQRRERGGQQRRVRGTADLDL